jgi:hypothetical protein
VRDEVGERVVVEVVDVGSGDDPVAVEDPELLRRVPVLSKHSTSTRPSASMVRALRTRAPRWERRRAAANWAALMRNGRPSGTLATARPTPAPTVSRSGRPRSSPAATTAPPEASAIGSVMRVIWARRRSTPDSGARCCADAALRPASAPAPVATTTASPWPVATVVPS